MQNLNVTTEVETSQPSHGMVESSDLKLNSYKIQTKVPISKEQTWQKLLQLTSTKMNFANAVNTNHKPTRTNSSSSSNQRNQQSNEANEETSETNLQIRRKSLLKRTVERKRTTELLWDNLWYGILQNKMSPLSPPTKVSGIRVNKTKT